MQKCIEYNKLLGTMQCRIVTKKTNVHKRLNSFTDIQKHLFSLGDAKLYMIKDTKNIKLEREIDFYVVF